MPTSTTNYALQKPLVNNATDQDLWGGELNDDLDDIDTLLRQGITNETQATQVAGFSPTASISVRYLYPCDATGGGFTATIPSAATAGDGATVSIKKIDATSNAITLAKTGGDTIDGAVSQEITIQNDTYTLVSDGVSAWNSIAKPAGVVDASTTAKGIVELATAAEVLTGTDATRAITPDAFAGNKSLAASGYYKFPGGFIIQWCISSSISSGSTTSVSLPISFPTACIHASAQPISTPGGNQGTTAVPSVTTSAVSVYNNLSAASTFRVLAMGY